MIIVRFLYYQNPNLFISNYANPEHVLLSYCLSIYDFYPIAFKLCDIMYQSLQGIYI